MPAIYRAAPDEIARLWRLDRWRPLWPLVWLALPLGFVQMLISLNANVPRLLVQAFAGERELGIFAAIALAFVSVTSCLKRRCVPGRSWGYWRRGGCRTPMALNALVTGVIITSVATTCFAMIRAR